MNQFRKKVLFAVVLVPLLAGCGGGGGAKVAPVQGKVTVGGSEPFAGGLVRFVPAPDSNLNSREATTDGQGNFKVMFNPSQPGLQPGDYKVMFSLYQMPDGSAVPDQKGEPDPKSPAELGAVQFVPKDYVTGTADDCTVTVPETGGTFEFDLPELKAGPSTKSSGRG